MQYVRSGPAPCASSTTARWAGVPCLVAATMAVVPSREQLKLPMLRQPTFNTPALTAHFCSTHHGLLCEIACQHADTPA